MTRYRWRGGNEGKLYLLTWVGLFIGYGWLVYSFLTSRPNVLLGEAGRGWSGCLLKQVWGIPCPACGSTRSVLALFGGQWGEAWEWNPLGYVLAVGLVLLPLWLLFDTWSGRSTYWHTFLAGESLLRKPPVAVVCAVLMFANWIWNLVKFS